MNCHYYLIVEPLLLEYHDDVSVQPSSFAVVKTKLKEYKVSFFTNTNQLYMIRIDIPNVADKALQQKELETIQMIKEHILSVLRLTYDHDVSLFPRLLWNFRKLGEAPNFHVKIEEIVNPDFDPYIENIRNTFVTAFPIRVQIKLIADAQDKRLPLQYRYLSLYKLLELEFKKKKKWTKQIEELTDRFEEEFRTLGQKKNLINYIHSLRDRCAHIKTTKGFIAVTQLSNKDMLEIDRFLPLMTKMCVTLINEKYRETGISLVNREAFYQKLKEKGI